MNRLQIYFFSEHIKEAEEKKKKKKKRLNKMQQAALLGGGAAMLGLGGLGYAINKGTKETNQAIKGARGAMDRANASAQAFSGAVNKSRETDKIVANKTRQAFETLSDLADSSGFEAAAPSSKIRFTGKAKDLVKEQNKTKSSTEKLQEIAENAEFGLPKPKDPLAGYETTKLEKPRFEVKDEVQATPKPKSTPLGEPLSFDEYSQKFTDLGAKAGVPPEDMQTVYSNVVEYAKSKKNPEKVIQRTYDEISNRTPRGLNLYNKFLRGGVSGKAPSTGSDDFLRQAREAAREDLHEMMKLRDQARASSDGIKMQKYQKEIRRLANELGYDPDTFANY